MSPANAFAENQRRVVTTFLDQVRDVSKRAEQTDEAGQWGVDGWIKVIHDLIDAQLRALASLTEATIQGPWWCKQPSTPSDLDFVKAAETTTYDRRFDVVKPFRRVGCPGDFIPSELVSFHPATLPAGEVEFRLDVPPAYWGANYKGTIRLSQICGPDTTPTVQKLDVTVGL